MGLEELTFDVEGVKLYVKPELHLYHDHAEHEPFVGQVPVNVAYVASLREGRVVRGGFQRYDRDKRIFLNALSDYVPTDPKNEELLKKYAQGMAEMARVYSALLQTYTYTPLSKLGIITEKNFYKNSQGEWRDIGDWYGVFTHEELLQMADAVK
ncbi:MAG: hypothetical protein AABX31_02585 [Nanoarchaeota archaeon]